MRSRKLINNVILYYLEMVLAILAGFILPRLIIVQYGSGYNGLVASITQFLELSVLLRAGVGGATMAALYLPLANGDYDSVSGIVRATDIHMRKIGIMLIGIICAGALIYPHIINEALGSTFTSMLFLAIGISSFAESFWGITYYILLSADQQIWFTSVVKSVCYVLNIIFSYVLITRGTSIIVVKLVSSLIFVIYPITLRLYVRKKYNLNKSCEPDENALSKRWDAFFHQLSNYVMNNTDIVILTLFTDLFTVSVYSVYYLAIGGVRRVVSAFSNGLESAYGNIIAKEETELLRKNFEITETLFWGLATAFYSTTALMIFDFVNLYTTGVHDVKYIEPVFAMTYIIAQFFYTVRIPYQFVIQAAGMFKETKWMAIFEPVLNISVSMVLVFKYGLIGIAIGTLIACMYRVIRFSIFVSKNIVRRPLFEIIKRGLLSIFECAVIYLVINTNITKMIVDNYVMFFAKGFFVLFTASIIVYLVDLIFLKDDIVSLTKKIIDSIGRR